jgi:hypothetical protein
VQAVGHEGHKDVRLDPMLELVKNGAQRQVSDFPYQSSVWFSKWLLRKRSFEHSIQQHGGKRIRKLLKCIA